MILEFIDAKEKQVNLIKTVLKPILKDSIYKTIGQNWWKDRGDFTILINLQNFSWNTKNDVNFCFNIGIILRQKEVIKNPKNYNLTVPLRENSYLPKNRLQSKFRNNTGYIINEKTDIDQFTQEIKTDFINYILPLLEKLKTIEDCLEFYGNIPFWGDQLKKLINIDIRN